MAQHHASKVHRLAAPCLHYRAHVFLQMSLNFIFHHLRLSKIVEVARMVTWQCDILNCIFPHQVPMFLQSVHSGQCLAPHCDGVAMVKGQKVPHASTFKAVITSIQEKKAVDETQVGGFMVHDVKESKHIWCKLT